MAEFEEKLNSILSDPDAMSRIMQLAQSFSGESPAPPPPPKTEDPKPDISTLFSGSMDPDLLLRLLPLLQELSSSQNSNARQLLYALRPYLKKERQEKVERALQLARLFRVGKAFLKGREG